jgi:hypothetical protein
VPLLPSRKSTSAALLTEARVLDGTPLDEEQRALWHDAMPYDEPVQLASRRPATPGGRMRKRCLATARDATASPSSPSL